MKNKATFILLDKVIRVSNDYTNGRKGSIVSIDFEIERAQVDWSDSPTTWVKFSCLILDINKQSKSIQTGTGVPSKSIKMSRIIEGYPAYLMTETDRVITKDGEIEVPVKKNKVTIKNENGDMKTVSVGYLLTLCEASGSGEDAKEESVDDLADKAIKRVESEKKETPKGSTKKPAAKTTPAKAKPNTPKGPGVIATILECIQNAKKGKDGVTFEQILATLVKKVKGREKDSMNATIKAQIGSSKRPLRMEREKKVTFEVVEVEVNKGKKNAKTVKHFSLKSTKGAPKASK